MTIIGYMRVSTHHQKFDSQEKALINYGIDQLYKEFESGKKNKRPQLTKALEALKPGDTFVIFKLDRLARGTQQLLQLLEEFNQRDINFISIQNNIDTSTPMGRFFFTVMSAFSEMEAELIRERVLAGLDAAKENGAVLGRPSRTKEVEKAIKLYQETDLTVAEISKKCRISIPAIYHNLKKRGISCRHASA